MNNLEKELLKNIDVLYTKNEKIRAEVSKEVRKITMPKWAKTIKSVNKSKDLDFDI